MKAGDLNDVDELPLSDLNEWDEMQLQTFKEAFEISPDKSIPDPCWARKLSQRLPDKKVHKPARPGIRESLSLLPLASRVGSYLRKERAAGRDPIFDLEGILMTPPNPGPYAGVPLGGVGSGCIVRGLRGDFRNRSLWPGRSDQGTVLADQFSLRVAPFNEIHGTESNPTATVLSICSDIKHSSLRKWNWGLDPKRVTYCAVYPRSWHIYEAPCPGVHLTCRQISPVLPNEYRETTLPTAVFVWTVFNASSECQNISMMFTFEGGTKLNNNRQQSGAFNRSVSIHHGVGQGVMGIHMPLVHQSNTVYKLHEEDENAGSSITDEGESEPARPKSCSPKISPQRRHRSNTNDIHEDPFSIAIASKMSENISISTYELLHTNSFSEASALWETFVRTGQLEGVKSNENSNISEKKEGNIGGAICQKISLKPGEKCELVFSLAWDVPLARFGGGTALPKRYTRYFGRSGLNAMNIADHAIQSYERWEKSIESWQNPILRNLSLPRFYRYTLFNELYFLSAGGALWLDTQEGKANSDQYKIAHAKKRLENTIEENLNHNNSYVIKEETSLTKLRSGDRNEDCIEKSFILNKESINIDYKKGESGGFERDSKSKSQSEGQTFPFWENSCGDLSCEGDSSVIGQFLYLEGLEYLMYNTYDVHFYASFALAKLWPMLELSLQRDVASAVFRTDSCSRSLLGDGHRRPRKVYSVVPHDLGSPSELPWTKLNAYVFQDVSRWKDLAPKFALQVCRDYILTNSEKFLNLVYPAAVAVMQVAEAWDQDNDGLIENQGFPDQTYDIWTASGPSAYTGGLWVAALSAMVKMASIMGNKPDEERYLALFDRARSAYDAHLWNGKYFNYDSGQSKHCDSIMADQMAGQWYARSCNIAPPVDSTKAFLSFKAILLNNMHHFSLIAEKSRNQHEKFHSHSKSTRHFSIGLVNGMQGGGNNKIDNTCIQSREVWCGVTYACAAAMLLEAGAILRELPGEKGGVSSNPPDSDQKAEQTPSSDFLGEEKGGSYKIARAKKLVQGAFECARGIHNGGWNAFGYWFQTPEAYEANGNYRSLSYMRPLAIWSIQCALELEPGIEPILSGCL